jgi:hypothetical protein
MMTVRILLLQLNGGDYKNDQNERIIFLILKAQSEGRQTIVEAAIDALEIAVQDSPIAEARQHLVLVAHFTRVKVYGHVPQHVDLHHMYSKAICTTKK